MRNEIDPSSEVDAINDIQFIVCDRLVNLWARAERSSAVSLDEGHQVTVRVIRSNECGRSFNGVLGRLGEVRDDSLELEQSYIQVKY